MKKVHELFIGISVYIVDGLALAYLLTDTSMLITIAIILIILWILGIVTSYTIGGFIHIMLIAAVILILVRLIQGRNPIA